ncbi:MAG: hypothetical protein V3V08_04725 [Nannocystaceae bacterium]
MIQALLTALATWKQRNPDRALDSYKHLVGGLLVALRGTVSLSDEQAVLNEIVGNQAGDAPQPSDEHPDNERVLSAVWRLIGLGVIYPRLREIRDGYPASIDT